MDGVEATVTGANESMTAPLQEHHEARPTCRREVVETLAEVQEAVVGTIAGANDSMTASLQEHREGSTGLRDRIAETHGHLQEHQAASASLREGVAATLQEHDEASTGLQEGIAESLQGHYDATAALRDGLVASLEEYRAESAGLRDGIGEAARTAKNSATEVVALQEVVAQLDTTLSTLQSDWRPQVDAVVAEGRAAARGVLEQVQAELEAALSETRASLRGQVKAIDRVTGSLGGSTERLVSAGQALLAYLGERDLWLERERDRVLHEVLDEFAQGAVGKGATGRLQPVLRGARPPPRLARRRAVPSYQVGPTGGGDSGRAGRDRGTRETDGPRRGRSCSGVAKRTSQDRSAAPAPRNRAGRQESCAAARLPPRKALTVPRQARQEGCARQREAGCRQEGPNREGCAPSLGAHAPSPRNRPAAAAKKAPAAEDGAAPRNRHRRPRNEAKKAGEACCQGRRETYRQESRLGPVWHGTNRGEIRDGSQGHHQTHEPVNDRDSLIDTGQYHRIA